MSVIPVFLNLPEDVSQYTRFTAFGSTTGTAALQTIANITGKGYLLDAIVAVGGVGITNVTLEFKLTIDGVVYFWTGAPVSGDTPALGLIDQDAIYGGYRRIVAGGGNGPTANTHSTLNGIAGSGSGVPRTNPSPTKTTGCMVIRAPIPFNLSCKVEALLDVSHTIVYEVHAAYK